MEIELDHQAVLIASAFTGRLSQNQWDAVQSFVYQTGVTEGIVNELHSTPFHQWRTGFEIMEKIQKLDYIHS